MWTYCCEGLGCELDVQRIGLRFLAGETDLSLVQSILVSPEAHQLPIQWVLGPLSPGESSRGVMLNTHSHLAPRSRMSVTFPSILPYLHGVHRYWLYHIFMGTWLMSLVWHSVNIQVAFLKWCIMATFAYMRTPRKCENLLAQDFI
jgi:hypothetical protein